MGRRRVHGGSAIWTERILNLADIPVFGKTNLPFFSPLALFAIPKSIAADPRAQDQTDFASGTTARTCEREGYVVRRQKWVKGEDGSSSWSLRRSGSSDGGGWMGQALAI